MAGWTAIGKTYEQWGALLIEAGEEIQDTRDVQREVVLPFMQDHVESQFDTGFARGGNPQDFSGEPKYEASKIARYGPNYGTRPLYLPPDKAKLLPSLIELDHPNSLTAITLDGLVMGSSLPYADDLLLNGGVGPYGERFPARNPFEMTPSQKQDLAEQIDERLVQKLESFLPLSSATF